MSDAYVATVVKKCIAVVCKKAGVEYVSERTIDYLCDLVITCTSIHTIQHGRYTSDWSFDSGRTAREGE